MILKEILYCSDQDFLKINMAATSGCFCNINVTTHYQAPIKTKQFKN